MGFEKKHFIAVSAIWFERFLECSRSQGSSFFSKSVWRFYHSLLNLGEDKLAIKNLVKDYIDTVWYPELMIVVSDDCSRSNVSTDMDYDMSNRKLIYDLNEQIHVVKLFEFIIQTIQDSGIGWQTFKTDDNEAWDYDDVKN